MKETDTDANMDMPRPKAHYPWRNVREAAACWKQIGASEEVMDVIKNGWPLRTLAGVEMPPMKVEPCKLKPEEHAFAMERVAQLCAGGCIEEPDKEPLCCAAVFLTEKTLPDGTASYG